MLERTREKLESYYRNEMQLGADGELHPIDRVTRINPEQCQCLADLHYTIKPDLSIETGLAYGFSTLPILDAMEDHNYGHHIAIDPGQMLLWKGIACAAVDQLGFSKRFTWVEGPSGQILPKLIAEGKRTQFVFFDGLHTFEAVLSDFIMADQMLDVGGLIIMNDMWLPSIRTAASFFVNNMENYENLPPPHENIFVIKKLRNDARGWDHFVPFDASGEDTRNKRKKGFFEELFSRRSSAHPTPRQYR